VRADQPQVDGRESVDLEAAALRPQRLETSRPHVGARVEPVTHHPAPRAGERRDQERRIGAGERHLAGRERERERSLLAGDRLARVKPLEVRGAGVRDHRHARHGEARERGDLAG